MVIFHWMENGFRKSAASIVQSLAMRPSLASLTGPNSQHLVAPYTNGASPMSLDAWVRIVSVFSLTFQGYSVCFSVEPVLYAVVSFTVMLIQVAMYMSSKPSTYPKFDLHKTIFTASLTTLSVILNFGDSDSVVAGKVVTTFGIILEAVDFGMNLEYKVYAETFGYKPEKVDTVTALSIGDKSKKPKSKKGSVKSE